MLVAVAALSVVQGPFAGWPDSAPVEAHPKERHLRNLRQLTFGGENAEAYWSVDGDWITFQSKQPGFPDEQIFIMQANGSGKRRVSTGKGRCTCSYFAPGGWVYFSSTHATNEGPQEPVDMRQGYVWKVNPEFGLYRYSERSRDAGSFEEDMKRNPEPILVKPGAYIAETTIDPKGRYLTFTSDFEGDLEIYRADLDGKNIRRLTNDPGYDGGPFVSWDGKTIVYRRDKIDTEAELQDYKRLLKMHMVRPSKLEIWTMNADGRNKRQVTNLGCASFAPFMHPDNKRIIFSSNFGDKKGREFEIWTIGADGHGLERITYEADFDGFPMFSRDGKKLIFASNRNAKKRGETNLFVADWVD